MISLCSLCSLIHARTHTHRERERDEQRAVCVCEREREQRAERAERRSENNKKKRQRERERERMVQASQRPERELRKLRDVWAVSHKPWWHRVTVGERKIDDGTPKEMYVMGLWLCSDNGHLEGTLWPWREQRAER